MAIATIDPATGETVERFHPLGASDLEARLERARVAFDPWRRRPTKERLAVLARAADILDSERARIAAIMTLEMGKLLSAAVDEATKCAKACRYYAETAERGLATEEVADGDGVRERVMFQALGPVLAIMPWNFPFWQVVRFVAPALAVGNVGLLKHASSVPRCARELEEIFRRAGAPEGVFQSLLVESSAVDALIADERIVAVTITGSEKAGRAVAAAAGKALKKTVLELGGSDPFIVLPSADLDRTAAAAVKARMINNGQSCIAAKRFIVTAPIYEGFRERFVAGVRALKVGHPSDPGTELGPLASAGIRDELAKQVDDSVAAGAKLLTGGVALDRPGFYYAPTVLEDVPPGVPAASDELFGPVAVLIKARDLSHAIEIANDSRFGLGASVWTRDQAEAERCAREIEAGGVFVNGPVVSDPRYPFGGIKASGYGRELGIFGLREFVNIKRVRIAP